MRHRVSKRWVVRKRCLSAPVVIPPKYSCLYLSLLRLYPSRLKEQAGNLKHHLLCSLMITLGDRSTTFSSLGGLVIQPSCRQLTDFLCPTAMCAGRFRSALLKCWRRKTRHLKNCIVTTALNFYWYWMLVAFDLSAMKPSIATILENVVKFYSSFSWSSFYFWEGYFIHFPP